MRPLIVVFGLLACHFSSSQENDDYIIRFESDTGHGYVAPSGDTVVFPEKYLMCFTDTFRSMAIVLDPGMGYVGINRNEDVLFKVFPFDNGPDYISEGLFRIVKGEKIGYANKLGQIIIEPQFDCAFPFEGGRAKVAYTCSEKPEGEHTRWISDDWFYIDKKGEKMK